MHLQALRATWSGASIPTAPYAKGNLKIDWTGWLARAKFVCFSHLLAESQGATMWKINCPVCRKPLEKKNPTDTVPCPCGKYVWKG